MRIKCFLFVIILLATGLLAEDFKVLWEASPVKAIPMLKEKLKSGSPEEKEQVLYLFMEKNMVQLVPDVIEAILDNSLSPRHRDTGWGRVHHQAATAMCKFARKYDGLSQKERGLDDYSFYNDGGVGTLPRRKHVHLNWKKWWEKTEVSKQFF